MNNSYKLSFKGISPAYTNKQGYNVIPIAQNPSQNQIDNAIAVTRNGKAHTGYNGNAFMWGEDLVVKKYKPENKAFAYRPESEIKVLDALYDNGIMTDKNIQKGIYAFKTPENEYYLVSTQIPGENPNPQNHNFNKDNLTSLCEIIGNLDGGIIVQNNSEDKSLEIKRIMHNDLSHKNINITNNKAGIFDFEVLSSFNINDYIIRYDKENGYHSDVMSNLSDTSMLPSNLRDFEQKTLCKYLKNDIDSNETFRGYMYAKSQYHSKLAAFYENAANKTEDKYFHEKYSEMKTKENIHSKLLLLSSSDKTDEYKDIRLAEAMKIQVSEFIYLQSPFSNEGSINPDQILSYIDYVRNFYNSEYQTAIENNDTDRIVYYSDCLDLIENWQHVDEWMNWQMKEPDEESFSKEEYQELKHNHDLFLSKITNGFNLTLDDVID